MVCSRCGAQVAPVDNFCRNCGVRLSQSAGITAADASSRTEREQPIHTAARSSRAKSVPSGARRDAALPPAHERKGTHSTNIFFGLVFLIAIAAAGVYFGTDLLREPGKPDRPFGADVPGSLSGEEGNRAGPVDNSPTSFAPSQSPEPSPSAPLESSEPSPRKAPLQTDEQQSKGTARSAKVPASAPTSRRASGAGAYETRDSTPLFELPSSSSRVVANIPGGTRVEVVSSKGDWLEVHSRRGNPPGFIRRQDAKFLEKTD